MSLDRSHLSLVPPPQEPAPTPVAPDFPVRIIRSARRRKTLQAKLVKQTIEVRIPEGMDPADEERHVRELVAKVRKKYATDQVDLGERAASLAKRYGLPEPTSIRWVSNQQHRFGSCSTGAGSIRISSRLVGVPDFVLDHVIIHELAHLVHPNHSAHFHALANQHPKAERAEGFLLAMSHGFGTDDEPPRRDLDVDPAE